MSLKDRFDRFLDYFTEDEEGYEASVTENPVKKEAPKTAVTPINQQPSNQKPAVTQVSQTKKQQITMKNNENITRLHARQQELAQNRSQVEEKVTIDVRYPRKYEEATEIVDLLIANESILIDFQYMTEIQARRCLDYLDGARYVLAGNLRKVASTMYLLTPINVVVNIEDIQLPEDLQANDYNFDMKRR